MRLKLDDQGHAVLQDGHPVYVHDDGKEIPFDAAATFADIKSLRGEAMRHRKTAEEAAAKLKAYEGIEDPDAARKALETVGNLDAKKLVDAGQVETLKAEINKAWEAKVKAMDDELVRAKEREKGIEQRFHGEIVGGSFARSKFIADRMVLPPDIAQNTFGRNFKVEDGKLRAYDNEGNPVFSRKTPGAPADFDEALEILVDAYPRKESILRANNGSGSGAQHQGGGGNPGATKKATQMSASEKGLFIRTNGLQAWNEKVSAEASSAAA